MNTRNGRWAFVSLLLLFAAGCRDGADAPAQAAPPAPAQAAAPAAGREDDHDHAAHEARGRRDAPDDHAGHAHGEGPSDLDRPVEELFAASCEHGKRTHACDECRYGVGVVRVPAKLLDGGLLRTARADRARVAAPLSLTGEIQLDERRVTHLAPRVEGTVTRVHASLGERVRRGQPLAELESVTLGEAESEQLSAQAALRLARAGLERQERLRAESISSERELLEAREAHEAASIRVRAARERLVRLGAAPADVDALAAGGGRGGALVVRAPADGLVLEMHAVPGELVRPDESIVTVGDVSGVRVLADLHEDRLARVLEAQRGGKLRAEISVRAFPGERFPGTVDFVGPTMDERTRTVKVRVAAANPEGKLRPGMFADVSVFLPGAEEVLAVPAAAVLTDEGRSFVFVRHEGEYWVRRPVEPGRAWAGQVELRSGLRGGETVAAEGAFLLKSDVLRSKMGAGCAD